MVFSKSYVKDTSRTIFFQSEETAGSITLYDGQDECFLDLSRRGENLPEGWQFLAKYESGDHSIVANFEELWENTNFEENDGILFELPEGVDDDDEF